MDKLLEKYNLAKQNEEEADSLNRLISASEIEVVMYPAKLSLRMEGKIKCFSDKVKLKKFIITKPLLYEMLKGLI